MVKSNAKIGVESDYIQGKAPFLELIKIKAPENAFKR